VTNTRAYVLPIVALIETMKGMRTPVTLRAQLSPRPKVLRETCFAEIVIEDGVLSSCDIRTADNHKLFSSLEENFIFLQKLGPLRWLLITSGHQELSSSGPKMPHAQQLPSSRGTTKKSIPRKVIMSLPPGQFKELPQRHKQVFLLIDGYKDSAEIGRLLSISQNSVESILNELYQLRLIGF